jgi:hypothetical protein
MFFITQHNVNQQYLERMFYQNDTNTSKNKIYFFGSSHINALNTTHIDKKIQDGGLIGFSTYNIMMNSDNPSRRLNTIDMVLLTKPQVVVYGIDMRSFVESNIGSFQNENKLLPDPQKNLKIFFNIFKENIPVDLSFLSSPKFSMLKSIRGLFQDGDRQQLMEFSPYPNAPTVLITKENLVSKSYEELRNMKSVQTLDQFRESEINKEVMALKQIIKEFKQNNIKIIIFTTPYPKSYGEQVQSKITPFNDMIKNIESYTDLKIYRLDYTDIDTQIWSDPTHIAINKNSTIYSNDVAKIILNEIGP